MKKIVVIGGGFAGSLIARKLESKFDLTLIDNKDYFEFTPSILRVITGSEMLDRVQLKHRDYLKRAEILVGNVKEVSKKYVLVGKRKIFFDYLCICSGSRYSMPIIKEQNIFLANRSEHLKESHKVLENSEHVLIIGAGLVGIELAAEICTHYNNKKIVVINEKGRIMSRNSEKTALYAENFLMRHNVQIIKGEKVLDTKKIKGIYHTNAGRKIKADLAFLCTGISPNFEFMIKNFKRNIDGKNKILVDEFLRLDGEKNIFAAGDVTSVHVEKTAQSAEQQAKTVVFNILSLEKKRILKKYIPQEMPLVISLGVFDAIFEYKKIVFSGLIPALMKKFIEVKEMFKLRHF